MDADEEWYQEPSKIPNRSHAELRRGTICLDFTLVPMYTGIARGDSSFYKDHFKDGAWKNHFSLEEKALLQAFADNL